eukprot:CAMPEP_0113612314 /NCGR_PEP_ID=MMETSP0017_2-20120614/6034_1 /TAXON_ID=2856 /ORGANISM="Cylindrotheca closterium" /LENGTH=405 /DNA_ID=CAMNT_0000521341 /DNA_START=183 /DNA_END=1400 /DNA_ORIENTATION=- /assembly_acc=CAM_ASM_000147
MNIDDGTQPLDQQQHEKHDIKKRIEHQLSYLPIDWDSLNPLLKSLEPSTARWTSKEDDPMGRLLLGRVLTNQAPLNVVETVLTVFPDCLMYNPAAFFMACRHYTTNQSVLVAMVKHSLSSRDPSDSECPFPWILSDLVTVSAAQAILEIYPQGVLEPSPMLSGKTLLDYLLRSSELQKHQQESGVSSNLWTKLKLILVSAECSQQANCNACKKNGTLSPAHVLLKRVLSYPDFFDNVSVARNTIWLLNQLASTDAWIFQKPDPKGIYPLHVVLQQECTPQHHTGKVIARELVKTLLQVHPQSARCLLHQRLPIHWAVEHNWPCHDLLLAVYPEALDAQDSTSELYPFQIAAAAAASVSTRTSAPCKQAESMSSVSALDITFELLRANPTHVRPMPAKHHGVRAEA